MQFTFYLIRIAEPCVTNKRNINRGNKYARARAEYSENKENLNR